MTLAHRLVDGAEGPAHSVDCHFAAASPPPKGISNGFFGVEGVGFPHARKLKQRSAGVSSGSRRSRWLTVPWKAVRYKATVGSKPSTEVEAASRERILVTRGRPRVIQHCNFEKKHRPVSTGNDALVRLSRER